MMRQNKIVNIGKNLSELRVERALNVLQYESALFTKKQKKDTPDIA